ncbi:hypothetical protein BDZ88DRAFT_115721 [Geranomyces variabilis]|nr:hypothetical protein BDZ88DRAFT_115721 [Geranomyces variabilis]
MWRSARRVLKAVSAATAHSPFFAKPDLPLYSGETTQARLVRGCIRLRGCELQSTPEQHGSQPVRHLMSHLWQWSTPVGSIREHGNLKSRLQIRFPLLSPCGGKSIMCRHIFCSESSSVTALVFVPTAMRGVVITLMHLPLLTPLAVCSAAATLRRRSCDLLKRRTPSPCSSANIRTVKTRPAAVLPVFPSEAVPFAQLYSRAVRLNDDNVS